MSLAESSLNLPEQKSLYKAASRQFERAYEQTTNEQILHLQCFALARSGNDPCDSLRCYSKLQRITKNGNYLARDEASFSFRECKDPQIEIFSPEIARIFAGQTAVVVGKKYDSIDDWEREKNSYLRIHYPHLYRLDKLGVPLLIGGAIVGAAGFLALGVSVSSCWEGDMNCTTRQSSMYGVGYQYFDTMEISPAHKFANERVLPGITIAGAALVVIGALLCLPPLLHKEYQRNKQKRPPAMHINFGFGRIIK
jgi:hypothetical protein